MKILIDIQGMQNLSSQRGIGRYTKAFATAIIENKQNHEILLLVNAVFHETISEVKDCFKDILPQNNIIIFHPIGPSSALEQNNTMNILTSELLREKLIYDIGPDIVIVASLFEGLWDSSITSIGKMIDSIPTVAILYDLIPYISPKKYINHKPTASWYYDKIDSLMRANGLLAISQSAKNEAIEHLNFDENKITNISSAVDKCLFKPSKPSQEILKQNGIHKPFLMHVSAFDPRKNFKELLRAFAMLDDDLKEAYQLVFVCEITSKQRNLLYDLSQKLGLKKDTLVLTGRIPDDTLITLYTSCYLFVFPSEHEGFGLPMLEAMSCGAAVIGSNTSSIPEVINMQEAMFNPFDTSSIATKITQALTDNSFYQKLKQNAKIQSSKFSWDKTAQKTIHFLETLIANQNTPSRHQSLKKSTSALIKTIVSKTFQNPPSQDTLIKIAQAIQKNEDTVKDYNLSLSKPDRLVWRVEGPFDSSYSLALVNREFARAIERLGHFVILHSTEGPGDFAPNQEFLHNNPDLQNMNLRALDYDHANAHVLTRNLYPPRVADMDGYFNILHNYAWEESGFPPQWVEDFNANLSMILVTSKHVQKILIDNGVIVPIFVTGNGVDHWQKITPKIDDTNTISSEGFKFLHVSSCFPRKGINALLEAYSQAFTCKDDVMLVIKTFQNPHNDIHKLIDNAKKNNPNYPRVLVIERDMSEQSLMGLYKQCDVLVAPSLAEGFGLPIAEAMLSGLPAITTNWSGQLDFCNTQNSWLVDYTFEKAQSHFNLFDSVWAKPDIKSLSQCMREAFATDKLTLKQKADYGKTTLLNHFKWIDVAQRSIEYVNNYPLIHHKEPKIKIAWISSWNTKCGIAAYSKLLLDSIEDSFEKLYILANKIKNPPSDDKKHNVTRCWINRIDKKNTDLTQTLNSLDINSVFIQYNFGFFDLFSLEKIIQNLLKSQKKVFITLHSVKDVHIEGQEASLEWIAQTLKKTNIFVHSVVDLNILKGFGLIENVTLFPHGVIRRQNQPQKTAYLKNKLKINTKKIIGSYGFMLPHKGIKELIQSFKIVHEKHPETHLLLLNALYPSPVSTKYADECTREIKDSSLQNDITMINEFLTDEESFQYLHCCDIIVMPYQQTQESSSAAVRHSIATSKPIICTPIDIFSDVSDIVHFASHCSIQAIADKTSELLSNDKKLNAKKELQQRWIQEHDWKKIAPRLLNIIRQKLRA